MDIVCISHGALYLLILWHILVSS